MHQLPEDHKIAQKIYPTFMLFLFCEDGSFGNLYDHHAISSPRFEWLHLQGSVISERKGLIMRETFFVGCLSMVEIMLFIVYRVI